jgi:two-component system, OmpR family, heavy metal sensor histidine kinase CusS
MRLSIRWRLTLWYTVALAVVLVGFGCLVYTLLARSLYQRIDQSLLAELQEIENKPNPNLAYWIKEAKEHENIFCIVYDPEGKVYERTEELPADSIPTPSTFGTAASAVGDVTLAIIGRQRWLRRSLRLGGKELTIAVLAPLEEVDAELRQLASVLLFAVPLALALAGGLGYFMARKALAPMEHLHQLTEEVTADRLDRRLPVVNPGDELGRLTQTINAMIGRLQHSFAEIRRFTADASHELRTPLTVIRTEAEVALRQPLSVAEYHQLVSSILEECEHLTRLVDQLLMLSREDTPAAKPLHEPLDLADLVGAVVDTVRPLAEARGLKLRNERETSVQVWGDETRLRAVFYNLLDNAIKYTPEGGEIEVKVYRNDHSAIVSVRDSGIGIPPEHLPRVFDRFYRVDKARSREQGGTGLGLSIAKTIVTAHGGQIDLTSSPTVGTICTVTFPAEPRTRSTTGAGPVHATPLIQGD